MASPASLYQVLGIPMSATCQEIKTAYRRLARVCHPDVATIDRKDTSADEFKKIYTAYSTLTDPEKRADYDRKLFRPKRPYCSSSSTVNSSSMAGFSGNNFESQNDFSNSSKAVVLSSSMDAMLGKLKGLFLGVEQDGSSIWLSERDAQRQKFLISASFHRQK
ncbi:hypothetical protein HHK36_008676 [Tetracentron sinense]|uniref:J domain-containing protein n=1 Tax=Tetracentron sinense TaxID=13715 RepID=A0A835DK74_TETSI|nr:hypothetical protein HHK36_008676 [Tetracentron sinense]